MFKIERVGDPGWLNTPGTVVAVASMAFKETRSKPDSLHAARMEDRALEVDDGDRFAIALPNGVTPVCGDTLALEVMMRERSLKSKWTKLSTF